MDLSEESEKEEKTNFPFFTFCLGISLHGNHLVFSVPCGISEEMKETRVNDTDVTHKTYSCK